MALLQIAEPGQSTNPHARRLAIGIDLGTTNSLVAVVRSGLAACLADANGAVLVPSVVHYGAKGEQQVGLAALPFLSTDPANTVFSVKRLMGRSLGDIPHAQHLPYVLTMASDQPEAMVQIVTGAGRKSPVQVSADLLSALRSRAQEALQDDLFGAVITVPAYFDEAQRQATKDAAQLAGINVLRLINEPTAAAIAYGLDQGIEGLYAIYDLGGGTFDVSILRLSEGLFEVVATGGDSALGGDDYDQALSTYLAQQHGVVVSNQEARQIKESLTEQTCTECTLEIDATGSRTQVVMVTRAEFEQVTASLTERTMNAVAQALFDAKVEPSEVCGVVMVGGATRMPHIQARVAQCFGKPPLTNLNPDEVVAQGAALQADQLAGNRPTASSEGMLLLDVTALSLGLETMGGLVERIIPRNTPIPTSMAQDFTTYQDGQTAMQLHVVQGERDLVQQCRSLGHFTLSGIPPMVAGAARVRVTFALDANGLLSVSAVEQTTGAAAQITVRPSYGLSDTQIADMLQESFGTAEQDIKARSLVQARVDAERLVQATQTALTSDAQLLSAQEIAQIESLIARCLAARASPMPGDIEQAIKNLAQGTEHFAALRMNNSIAKALSGRSIESLSD